MGSFIEQFVPETLRRIPDQDELQNQADLVERRMAMGTAFAVDDPAEERSLGPVAHFAVKMSRPARLPESRLCGAVVYRTNSAPRPGHACKIDTDVFLVDKQTDRHYRGILEWVLHELERHVQLSDIWPHIHAADGPHVPSGQDSAADDGAAADPAAPLRPLDPGQWVVYTRRSSSFMAKLADMLERDPVFNAKKITLNYVGGAEVHFPVVAFFLGHVDEFVRERQYTEPAPAEGHEVSDTVLDFDASLTWLADMPGATSDPLSVAALEEGRTAGAAPTYSNTYVLDTRLAVQDDWIVIPTWLWTMYAVGRRDPSAPGSRATCMTSPPATS